jgi:hypothetical protein
MGSELVGPASTTSDGVDNGAVDADLSQADNARDRMIMKIRVISVFLDILCLLNPLKRGIFLSMRY